jgi:hypothetical protein
MAPTVAGVATKIQSHQGHRCLTVRAPARACFAPAREGALEPSIEATLIDPPVPAAQACSDG